MVDWARLRQAMVLEGFEALVASSYANVFYLSGAAIRTIKSIPLRLALVLVPLHTPPTMIVCTIEEALARQQSGIGDIRGYAEFRESPIALLESTLRERGLASARVGIEMTHLAAVWYEDFLRRLPHVALEPCDGLLERLRAIKTPNELLILREAAAVAQRAIADAVRGVELGDSEREIAWEIERRAREAGADGMRFCYVGIGANSGLIHPAPGDRRLGPDDLLRIDAAIYKGVYAADLACTLLPPSADPEQRRCHRAVRDAKDEVVRNLIPGVRASELYEVCRGVFASAGLELWMPHIGHGIGIDGGHEFPLLEPGNDARMEAGMVMCIEPLCTSAKGEAFHFEDMVEVTPDGARYLSRIDVELGM